MKSLTRRQPTAFRAAFPSMWPSETETMYRVRADERMTRFVISILDTDLRFQPTLMDDDATRLERKQLATLALLDAATSDALVARDRTPNVPERRLLYLVAHAEYAHRVMCLTSDLCDRLADRAVSRKASGYLVGGTVAQVVAR